MTANREYKSDVFSMLMQDARNALQLYNALNGSDYQDPDMLEMCTLDSGISLSIRNDASFLLDMHLSLYEHQSTICPNMPARSLLYTATILRPMLKNRNLYGESLVKIPTPHFAVFYNGTREQPEQYELKLSSAFAHPTEQPELELKCRVYNINRGKNRELLDRCPVLKEYMIFVDYVRFYYDQGEPDDLKTAIEKAIDRCISENVLADFLRERRGEVLHMIQLDYTFERQIMLEREAAAREAEHIRKEGLMRGREEGLTRGREEGLTRGHEEERSFVRYLLANDRMEDLRRAMQDDRYREQLMREFQESGQL